MSLNVISIDVIHVSRSLNIQCVPYVGWEPLCAFSMLRFHRCRFQSRTTLCRSNAAQRYFEPCSSACRSWRRQAILRVELNEVLIPFYSTCILPPIASLTAALHSKLFSSPICAFCFFTMSFLREPASIVVRDALLSECSSAAVLRNRFGSGRVEQIRQGGRCFTDRRVVELRRLARLQRRQLSIQLRASVSVCVASKRLSNVTLSAKSST
jgi:hypothetical protein